MADLAERLTAEARADVLVGERDLARAQLAAVTRNRHDDSVTAGRLWRLLEKDSRRAVPVAELRALFDHDRGGRATPLVEPGTPHERTGGDHTPT